MEKAGLAILLILLCASFFFLFYRFTGEATGRLAYAGGSLGFGVLAVLIYVGIFYLVRKRKAI